MKRLMKRVAEKSHIGQHVNKGVLCAGLSFFCVVVVAAQTNAPSTSKTGATPPANAGGWRDPAAPLSGKPHPRVLPRPTGAIARSSIDERSMRVLIHELVSCGTRLTLSSWDDPKRGAGCGRDKVAARFNEIAKTSGGKLQISVDKFESRKRCENREDHFYRFRAL